MMNRITWRTLVPNFTEIRQQIWKWQAHLFFVQVIKARLTKHSFKELRMFRLLFVKNCYTEFYEIPTNELVCHAGSQISGRSGGVSVYGVVLFKFVKKI